MPTPNALDAARKFREQLAKNEAAAAERMGQVYARLYQSLLADTQGLAEQLAGMSSLDRETVMRLARVKSLLAQTADQVARFGGTAQSEIILIENQAIQAGIADALKLMELSLPDLPPNLRAQITGSFVRLPADAIEAAAGLMGPDSPLRARLEAGYGEYVAGQVEAHFLDGIGTGMRADKITALLANNLQTGLGSGLTSLLTTLRTAQIKSYQVANHATYMANSNVVKGWIWYASLDNRCCLSCIEQHGTIHPVEETLNDHHNGRCAPVPLTASYRDLGLDIDEPERETETGPAWFARQPEAMQRQMMGPGMFEAYKAGKVGFGDFSRRYDDGVYGELLREASLKDILGAKAKEYYQ